MTRQERLEEKRADRALVLLNSPLFWRFAHALDICGWRITPHPERGEMRFPVPIGSKRKHWPSWIEDMRAKPQPKLRLIDGGKPDDGA